jgi:hypothetical protein
MAKPAPSAIASATRVRLESPARSLAAPSHAAVAPNGTAAHGSSMATPAARAAEPAIRLSNRLALHTRIGDVAADAATADNTPRVAARRPNRPPARAMTADEAITAATNLLPVTAAG